MQEQIKTNCMLKKEASEAPTHLMQPCSQDIFRVKCTCRTADYMYIVTTKVRLHVHPHDKALRYPSTTAPAVITDSLHKPAKWHVSKKTPANFSLVRRPLWILYVAFNYNYIYMYMCM